MINRFSKARLALLGVAFVVTACGQKTDTTHSEVPAQPGQPSQQAAQTKATSDDERADALRKKGFDVMKLGSAYSVAVPVRLPADAAKELIGFSAVRFLSFDDPAPFGEKPGPVTDDVLQSLTGLDDLAELSVAACPNVTDAGFTNLDRFPRLRRLSVSRSRTIGDGLAAEASKLKGLEELLLADTQLTDKGLTKLLAITNLKLLHIGGTQVTESGLKSLNAFRELDALVTWELPMSEQILSQLDLPKLRNLHISGTHVNDACLGRLSRFPKLENLYLARCSVTDEGIQAVKDCEKLGFLSLYETKVTESGVGKLMKVKPGLRVSGP
jgi:hypothetical protein